MRKLFLSLLLAAAAFWGVAAHAAEGIHMDPFPTERLKDLPSLQNGARLFSNYCLTCHGASLMRWNRLQDVGLDDKQIKDFLILGTQKVGDVMTVAMRPADAATLATVTCLLGLVALAVSALPAMVAAAIDPVSGLRAE